MNPTDEKEPRLPEQAEELLENWPIPERDEGDWESLAAQIDARIERTPPGSTEDALLMAPLPEGAEDEGRPERRSHPRVKRPSDGGLAALAKATMLVRDEMQKTELAQATLDVARRARKGPRPRASRAAVAVQSPEPAAPQRTSRSVWISMTFGVVGIAAAVVMYISTRPAEPMVAAAPAAGPDAPALEAGAAPAAVEAKSAAGEDAPALSVEEVPLAEPEQTKPALTTARAKATKPPPVAAQEAPANKEPVATAAPPAAAGPSEAGMVMADGRAGVADRPSPGAIQAAVGSVMGAARACTAGLNAASRAAVTFGSNGQVSSVSVTGPAQGTSAESCIVTALSRARVQPFARPSYTVKLSVRPE